MSGHTNLIDVLDSQDFYEVCQQYRHAQDVIARPGQLTAAEAFEALKAWLRANGVPGTSGDRDMSRPDEQAIAAYGAEDKTK